VVGDYGNMRDLEPAKAAFQAMNAIKENNSKIDMFVTVGDNIYPSNPEHPSKDEINKMIGLFKGDKTKDMPVYGVRGNHDCYFKD
jgi:DNA repair exonuclease SbcCD nuclease subunit